MWVNILSLSLHLFGQEKDNFFKNLPELISSQSDNWKKWAYEKMDPENSPVPDLEDRISQDQRLGMFFKICLIRAIREDRVITSIQQYIKSVLGD